MLPLNPFYERIFNDTEIVDNHGNANVGVADAGGILLSEAIEKFLSVKSSKINDRSLKTYRSLFSQFLSYFKQDLYLKHVSRDDCRSFLTLLSNAPKNFKKFSAKNSVSLKEAAEKYQNKPDLLPSNKTIENYHGVIVSFFKFMEKEGYLEKSPATGLESPRNSNNEEYVKKSYTVDELDFIFNSFLYTDPKNFWTYKYWIPLIGLWTGMRLNEICELKFTDIYPQSEQLIFHLKKDGRKYKTKNSPRKIPIHPTLLKCGLLEYVEYKTSIAKGSPNIFHDVRMPATKYRSDTFSKDYRHFMHNQIKFFENRKVDGKRNFHSYRHTFTGLIKHTDINRNLGKQVMGWSKSEEGMFGHYHGEGLSFEKMCEEFLKLDYANLGLDLTHLYTDHRKAS